MGRPRAIQEQDDDDDDEERRQLLAPVLLAQAERVVERLADVDDRFVRWKAIAVFGAYDTAALLRERPQVLDQLAACLDHPYACTRGAALLSLSRMDPASLAASAPEVLRGVALRLRDEEAAVRWACCHGLKKLLPPPAVLAAGGSGEGIAALVAREAGLRLAEEGEDEWVQREARRLLGRLLEAVPNEEAAEAVKAYDLRVGWSEERQGDERLGARGGLGLMYRPD